MAAGGRYSFRASSQLKMEVTLAKEGAVVRYGEDERPGVGGIVL